jgi:pyridoxal phosphate enzyme (YggS family)
MIDAVEEIRARRADVLDRIAAACARAGRPVDAVTLVAVSKTVAADRLVAAVAAGLTVFGENRVQEGVPKVDAVPGATWHLVGPLQSNKARRAIEAFDVIESVDSQGLAERLDRLAREVRSAGPTRRYPILLQVNVDDDPAKAGFDPGVLASAVDRIAGLDALEVRGLMTIGRLAPTTDAARSTFAALRDLSARIHAAGARLGPALSMGMSDDFEIAIEEGATIVRVGRALFGDRPVATAAADGR